MKKNTFYLILFLLISNSNFSQKKVFSTFKTLTTQAEVDEFGSHNYTHIDSWLRIEGDDITNLNALNSITNIKSSLWIQNNPNLENIDGLSKIDSIAVGQFSAQLKITNNPKLKNLEGLQGLIETSSIEIFGNKNLININGLSNVSEGVRKIHISENDNLDNLYGLLNISEVSGAIWISNNKNLKSLTGLENLKSISSKFWIIENIALENLNALSNLEHTDGLWITKNEKLNNFCGLTKLVNSTLPSSFTSTIGANLYNPSIDDIKNGNCSDSINFSLEYPKEEDVYIVGRKIRLQFPSNVGIPTSSEISLFYSFDSGASWIDVGSYTADDNLGEFLIAPEVTEPKNIFIKIEANVNGNDLSFTREKIMVQPVNYYEDLGFKEDGVSEIDFPLEGYRGSDNGWIETFGSPGHFCLDNYARDFVYRNIFSGSDITCGKAITSPFDGVIIGINKGENYNSSLVCGGTTNNQDSGLYVVIQSNQNKNFAMNFIHLKSVNNSISKRDTIKKGDLIGAAGGSGTSLAHVHTVLYKNVYDWLSEITPYNNIFELISDGLTIYNVNQNFCNNLKENNASEVNFKYSTNDNVSLDHVIVENANDFTSFLAKSLKYFVGNIKIIIQNSSNKKRGSYKESNINTLKGMESIVSIDGDLYIENTDIENLNYLKNITFIGGNLIIKNNKKLSDFCGIQNLLKNKGLIGDLVIVGNNINPEETEIIGEDNCQKTLGHIDFTEKKIKIFPNPVLEEIRFSDIVVFDKIEVYNIVGEKVISFQKGNMLNVELISTGIYFLKIINKNEISFLKFYKH